MIEVEVHSVLRDLLRLARSNSASLPPGLVPNWPHHLTMARLVARGLRLGRPALIQTGVPTGATQGRYRLSYLIPALLWKETVTIVAPKIVQQRLLEVEIPHLKQWLEVDRAIQIADGENRHPILDDNFKGLVLTSPEIWLADRLHEQGRFANGIPTIIDGADDIEVWARDELTVCLQPGDWDELMFSFPEQADVIRDTRVKLTLAIFQHPRNPYECYLIESSEQDTLSQLYAVLHSAINENSCDRLPASWKNFWQQWQTGAQLMWASIGREGGKFSLYCTPIEVALPLSHIWQKQPVVLIGSALDLEPEASVYRQQLGLGDLTYLKFSPDQHSEAIQLYVPDRLPMPNTPEFQRVLIQQVSALLASVESGENYNSNLKRPVVILVGDVPLKPQIATILAAEFGSRVQMETTRLSDNSILISGWEFWRQSQELLPAPQLLIIATLPIPSLENPRVAGRVAYYREQRKDWFRLYLLPVALQELQRAIAPVRECQGVVALLDNRVNHRSYGKQVLAALSPLARINYPDATWFRADR